VKGSGVVMEQWHTVTQPTNNGVEKREDAKASVQLISANRCQTQVPIYCSTCAKRVICTHAQIELLKKKKEKQRLRAQQSSITS
jgi:hypothetical protein